MAVDTSVIGKPTGSWKVTIERSPISNFAGAVTDTNPVFFDRTAAQAAGFDDVPATPTFTIGLPYWAGYQHEIQPDDPTGGAGSPLMGVIGGLMSKGGLILHGEQEFQYFKPIVVGDTLIGEGSITDIYEKDSDKALMTFVVSETRWTDASTGEPVLTERFNLIHRFTK